MDNDTPVKLRLKSLKLTNFKNFRSVELVLGSTTIVIGANATGKANLREAFRFLHADVDVLHTRIENWLRNR